MLPTDSLQTRLHEWRKYNFPHADAEQQLLGVIEEVGELAHAILKEKQGIRHTATRITDEKDAVGDIAVFLMGYCSYNNWSFEDIVEHVAMEVMQRNWRRYPRNGFTA